MKKYTLKNGLTLIHDKTNSDSVVIQVMVKVGSNHEHDGIRGIAHFHEHMLFEGTTRRKDSTAISAEIENLGGEMNAYTNSEVTAYHIKVLRKHFDVALDVLSDMMLNSTFPTKMIEKERSVILKEIHMVLDDPRNYKWILFQETLLKKHPMRHPTYGTVRDVKGMTREKLLAFYKKYYHPKNMMVSVVGNVLNLKEKIEKAFGQNGSGAKPPQIASEAYFSQERKAKQKRKTQSCYTVLGFLTPGRAHKDSYALDILEAIHGRGQSGRMFDTIRTKHGLCYEVGVRYDAGKDIGYMAVHASTDPKKAAFTKSLMVEQFRKPATTQEVKDAKTFIEGNFLLQQENSEERADELCFMEYADKAEDVDSYVSKIKKVPFSEVIRVQKKYFMRPYAIAVVGP